LQEQRQESDEEHEEDRDNAVADPVEHGEEVVATFLSTKEVSVIRVLADLELLVHRAKEHHCTTQISSQLE